MGKKRKKIWKSILLCIFWTVWKKRNRLAFRGGVLDIQKLKNSFVNGDGIQSTCPGMGLCRGWEITV